MSVGDVRFVVEATDTVELVSGAVLSERQIMSPYVWRREGGGYGILVRAVPQTEDDDSTTGRIWYGTCEGGGLRFRMEDEPLIVPGPEKYDAGGCEDPTVVHGAEGCIVYYTGVDAAGEARLCWASGPDIHSLEKRGLVLESIRTQGLTKEATVERTDDGDWRLFYEFAREEASLVGVAVSDQPNGPWREEPEPFAPRPDMWDSWHLSTGPILNDEPERPIMFYNGGTHDAAWRIGWVAFAHDCMCVVDRCAEPLIAPTSPHDGHPTRDIAFATSLVTIDGSHYLYYTFDDCTFLRATIRRA